MPEDFYEKTNDPQDPPVAISHIVRTLRNYLPVIALSLAAVMLGYLILAVAIYVLSPAQSVTTLRFRLEFTGAEHGQYPNGTKFSSAEIITTPVLLKAYNNNDLGRFTTFADFTKSIFVLESNTAQDALTMEYQARLADPKLSPVDRDRLQREYESKLASLGKDQFALNYLRPSQVRSIPEVVVRKTLHDILEEWAEFVSKEQHVLEYRVALLSPSEVATMPVVADPIMATQMLRTSALRVQLNIDAMRRIPAADLIQTAKDQTTLFDLAARLEDILRYHLDPLVESIAGSSLMPNRTLTIRFLETQVAYDQRLVDAQRQRAEAARQALTMYMSNRTMEEGTVALQGGATPAPSGATQQQQKPNETVMPQLSDTFLDRVIQFAGNAADLTYRKTLAEDFRESALRIVPLQQGVGYDTAVLNVVRSATAGSTDLTRPQVDQELLAMRQELRRIVEHVHEIHKVVSRNMNPSTQLMSVVGVPSTRFERSIGIKKLFLYGILTCFIALPVIVVLCLVHNRIREEEAAERSRSPVSDAIHGTV
jgi:hypothetical protein